MKLKDNVKTIEITIRKWDGTSYGEDMSYDYFNAGSLPYDNESEAYIVDDVDYCVDMAMSETDEGARAICTEDGDTIIDDSIIVDVTDC